MMRSIQSLIQRLEQPLVKQVQGAGGWATETATRKRWGVILILLHLAAGVLLVGWLTDSGLVWSIGAAVWVLMAFFVIGLSLSPVTTMKRTARFIVWGGVVALCAYVVLIAVLVAT